MIEAFLTKLFETYCHQLIIIILAHILLYHIIIINNKYYLICNFCLKLTLCLKLNTYFFNKIKNNFIRLKIK